MAANDLILYTNPQSRGRIVRWMLEEIGEPYRTVLLDYGGAMRGPEFLAINPMGKVPALQHGDVVVTETAAICAYLADAFAPAGLAPSCDSPLRGAYYRWLFFAAGPLEAAVSNRALGFVVPSERKGMIGYGSYEETLATLEAVVRARGPYLLGSRFSAADVYVGSHLAFGMRFGSIDKRPGFEDYCAMLDERPARRRAAAVDDAAAATSASQR